MGAADRIADTLLRIGQIQGDSLSRTGDIQARAMEIAAAARAGGVTGSADALARATAANGQIWGQTLAQLGQLPGQVLQQQRQGKIADQEMAMRKLQLDQATHAAAGEKALASNLAGDQLALGATGPRQESYLGADGLFDVPKITQALASGGYGDIAPQLVERAASINDSITKHQTAVRQATTAQTVLLGDMADGVSKMVKSGTPIDRALDFVAAPALASKSIDPQQYQQVRAQLLQLPPEQQQAALANLMDQASKAAGGSKTLSKDAIEVDRYGNPVASNVPAEPNKGDYTINGQRFHADGTAIGTTVPTQTAPPSLESKNMLINGKAAVVNFNPKTGIYSNAAGDDVSAQVRPIPPASVQINNAQAAGAQNTPDWTRDASRPTGPDANKMDPVLGLTPNAVYQGAVNFILDGQLPNMGLSRDPKIQAKRDAYQNKAAAIAADAGMDIPTLRAAFKANQSSLTAMQKMQDTVQGFMATADKNADLLKQSVSKLPDTGSPLLNQPLRAFEQKVVGNAAMAPIATYLKSVSNEYARIISQPNLAGQLTDSARSEATQLLDPNATVAQMLGSVAALQNEGNNRLISIGQQIQRITGRMGIGANGNSQTPSPVTAPTGVPSYADYLKSRGGK